MCERQAGADEGGTRQIVIAADEDVLMGRIIEALWDELRPVYQDDPYFTRSHAKSMAARILKAFRQNKS